MITQAITGAASAAPDPDELDDIVARLLELHGLATPRHAPEGLWEPSRRCGCERPLPLRDEWFPSWIRCLHCGRDVDERHEEDPAIAQEILELVAVMREHATAEALEQIDDELYPYFVDDPDRCAFPNDGRMEPESPRGPRGVSMSALCATRSCAVG